MVNVFITIDTEVWPDSPGWPHTPLPADYDPRRAIEWYLHGGRGAKARGVPYQLDVLAKAGLKATYFVDPMFSYALGLHSLQDLVGLITEGGQEVGLHLHPEWLTDPRCNGLPRFVGPLLNHYTEADQTTLVRMGLERLSQAGSPEIQAFRAGGWGANCATLRALRTNAIRCDSSLNARFPASFPDISTATKDAATQPFMLEGVSEFAVTNFSDWPPSGRRPLHVCAASLAEFQSVLEHAHANRWRAIVIVLHSFEFVRVDRVGRSEEVSPQRLLARRFERLCAFLAENRAKFKTCHFAEVRDVLGEAAMHPQLPRSTRLRTVLRHAEQLASRFI